MSKKQYYRDLKQQVYDRLVKMLKAGEGQSRKADKAAGNTRDKIYSYSTYNTYRKQCNYFVDYVRQHHPECTNLHAAERYVGDYIRSCAEEGGKTGHPMSSHSIRTAYAAVCKLYGITPESKNYVQCPQRHREDITRSRGEAVRDRHFSKTNNAELIAFCRGTGCRRNVLEKLEGRDLYSRSRVTELIQGLNEGKGNGLTPKNASLRAAAEEALKRFPDKEYFLLHRQDKGGKTRFAPIVGNKVDQIVERMRNTGEHEKVWHYVSSNADIHSYRADYARTIYRENARPVESIPYDRVNRETGQPYRSGVYCCRKDEAGKVLDRTAMLIASIALGHNRIDVIANHYLHGL